MGVGVDREEICSLLGHSANQVGADAAYCTASGICLVLDNLLYASGYRQCNARWCESHGPGSFAPGRKDPGFVLQYRLNETISHIAVCYMPLSMTLFGLTTAM